ncbi:MAG: ATP-dependent RNA helicase RhlB, partial [Desulfobacterales bacterium]|nr:ATP-dependent RNA helicase RhlB [Desulfobacterales bacterium]
HDPEDYVHRIGRTGRAGATGTSVSFADEDDSFYIPAIEKFMGRKLSCIEPNEEWLTMPKPVFSKKKRVARRRKKVSPKRRP